MSVDDFTPPSAAEIGSFEANGWLLQRTVLGDAQVDAIDASVQRLRSWADSGGPGIHHFEQTAFGPAIARSEYFLGEDDILDELMIGVRLPQVATALFGEPATLFKEKINYKHPGGGGFAPHQDAAAYRFAERHISCMVPLDPATEASGCLWVAPGYRDGLLPVDSGNRIAPDVADRLAWEPVEVFPGDLLWFDSFTPHKSGTNTTDRPRRAFYLTYNAASAGDLRAAYYADKTGEFAREGETFGGDRVRLSISDDFLGKPIEAADGIESLRKMFDAAAAGRLYDEAITERQHALQCAALARAAGASPSLVTAALCHDIGHFLVGDLYSIDEKLDDDAGHERAGAAWLRQYFGPHVSAPVALHVAAKRYLCAVEPGYFEQLSPSSVRSLAVQGGPMTPDEVRAFERNRFHAAAVQLRRWDDQGKDPDIPDGDLDAFLEIAVEALAVS